MAPEMNLDSMSEIRAEVRLPLEIIANLIYLAKHHAEDVDKVRSYMDIAQTAIADLILALAHRPEGTR